jgi:hypothetical protein
MNEYENIDVFSSSGNTVDNRIELLNSFFRWKKEFMHDDSILDSIKAFSHKFDYNVIELAQEFSEIPAFVDICEQDCRKFKYSTIIKTDNIGDEWE